MDGNPNRDGDAEGTPRRSRVSARVAPAHEEKQSATTAVPLEACTVARSWSSCTDAAQVRKDAAAQQWRDKVIGRSSRLRRTEARLSGEDVTGAVSRRSVHASAWRRQSSVELLFSLMPTIPSMRGRCTPSLLSLRDVLSLIFVQRLVRFGLRGKPAAVGLCRQFSSRVEPCSARRGIRQ